MTVDLKQRYRFKWRVSARRELLVLWLLNHYYELPRHGLLASLTGLGAGSNELIPRFYNTPEEAFDITVYRVADWKPVAYIDVTGISSPRDLQPGKGLCVGIWKAWKAEKLGLEKSRVWFVHVEDDGPRLRWINLEYLERNAERHRLRSDEKPLLCLASQKWRTTQQFIRWLREVG